ncbi:hypothetical protein [Gorillibacterium sp. sgz5001074]|uniref:hypothetical protein n=1 Tax=Gorillibacterium sp. sgz5001074 TaxID=3446695 RepID=UPI003F66852E
MDDITIDRVLKSKDLLNLTDEELISLVEQYVPSQGCSGAAYGYLQIVSHICYFREHLQSKLMKIAIRPIIYLGINDHKEVLGFITGEYLIEKTYKPATEFGRDWIIGKLQLNETLLKDIFEEIVIEENIRF